MREVKLLVQGALPEDVLRLLVPVWLVEADVEEDKIAKWRVDVVVLSAGALEQGNLLLVDVPGLFDLLCVELVCVDLAHALIHLLHEGLSHLNVLLLVGHRDVVLDLREILAQRFEAHLQLLSVLERAPLLELVYLLQQRDPLHASLLGIVAQVAKAIPHP